MRLYPCQNRTHKEFEGSKQSYKQNMNTHLVCWHKPRTDKHRFEVTINEDDAIEFSANPPATDWAKQSDFKRVSELLWQCSKYKIRFSSIQNECLATAMVLQESNNEFIDGFCIVERYKNNDKETKYPTQEHNNDEDYDHDEEEKEDDDTDLVLTLIQLLCKHVSTTKIRRGDRNKMMLCLFNYLNSVHMDEVRQSEILEMVSLLSEKMTTPLPRHDRNRIGGLLAAYINQKVL